MDLRGSGKNKNNMPTGGTEKSIVEDTLLYATEMAKELMGSTGSGIMFYKPDERRIALQYPALDTSREKVSRYNVPVNGRGAAVKTFNSRKPFFTNDCSSNPDVIHKYTEMYQVEKLLTFPLEWGSEVIGVWHVTNKKDGDWGEADLNRFSELTGRMGGIINQARQWQMQEQRHAVWLSLMHKIAGNGDVQTVAEVLSHAVGLPLMVVDRWGRCRASVNLSGGMMLKEDSLKFFAGFHKKSGLVRVLPSVENRFDFPVLVAPLGISGNTAGYLLVPLIDNRHIDETLINQAAIVLAVALNGEDRLSGVIERLSSDFLDRLVSGSLSEEEAYTRSGRLGLDLRRGWVTVLAVPDLTPASGAETQNLWQRLLVARDMLWSQLEELPGECWPGVLGDCSVVVLASQESGGAIPEVLPRTIQQVLKRYAGGITFSVGVGEMVCSRPAHYADAFREAKQAVEIGRKLDGHGKITFCSSLGANLLLYEAGRSAASRSYCDRLLNQLVEHDRKHGSQLLETLEAYLEEGGNITAAARTLHTHVNTVRYRLSRVEEITGRSLKSHKNRFEFQILLQLRKLRG